MKRLVYVGPLTEAYIPLIDGRVRRDEPFEIESDGIALRLLQRNPVFAYADTHENPHIDEEAGPIGEDLAVPQRIQGFGRTKQAVQHANGRGEVMPYNHVLNRIADRYFAQWLKQRKTIREAHKRQGRRFLEEYDFADVAAMRAFMDEQRARKIDDIENALRERSKTKKHNDDALGPAQQIHAWLGAEAGLFGGIFGKYLTMGAASIVTQAEVFAEPELDDAALRARPPVCVHVLPSRDVKIGDKLPPAAFYALPMGESHGFNSENELWPDDVRELFVALTDELNTVLDEPAYIGSNRPSVRAAYRAFADAFWTWYESDQRAAATSAKTIKRGPVFPIRNDAESFLIPCAPVFQGAHRATTSQDGWAMPADDFPYFDDAASNIRYSIGGVSMDGTFDPKTGDGFQADLAAIEPEMSLAYAAAMGAWTQAFHSGTLSKSGAVVFHVNHILVLRGLKRTKDGTFKPEQKRDVAKHLRRLARLHVRGEGTLPNGKRTRLTGQLLEIVEAEAEDLFGMTPYGFAIRPGLAVAPFFEQSPQLAHFFTKLATLDTKQGVERIAYLLGLYLVFQFRIREKTQNFAQPFLVKTFLEGARVQIEKNAVNFSRFCDSVESALDRLKAEGVTAAWEYVAGDIEALPKRGWFRPWLKCRVQVTPPSLILGDAARRSDGAKKAIAAAKKTQKRPCEFSPERGVTLPFEDLPPSQVRTYPPLR